MLELTGRDMTSLFLSNMTAASAKGVLKYIILTCPINSSLLLVNIRRRLVLCY